MSTRQVKRKYKENKPAWRKRGSECMRSLAVASFPLGMANWYTARLLDMLEYGY
jgi:hypothetical protein